MSPLFALPAGSLLSAEDILERRIIQHALGQQPLEPRILRFQGLEALRVGYGHATEFRLPDVVRRIADSVLAAQLCDLRACLGFLRRQNLHHCRANIREQVKPSKNYIVQ